jgi:hypothetical protein
MAAHKPRIEMRCRHLACQSVVETVCLDCGKVIEMHDEMTGMPIYRKGHAHGCDCP